MPYKAAQDIEELTPIGITDDQQLFFRSGTKVLRGKVTLNDQQNDYCTGFTPILTSPCAKTLTSDVDGFPNVIPFQKRAKRCTLPFSLSSRYGTALAKKRVTIQKRRSSSQKWRTFATGRTSAAGEVRLRVTALRRYEEYRVLFKGDAAYHPAEYSVRVE